MTEKRREGRGCFFYGCLTFILIFIGVVVGGYFGTRKAIKEVVKSHTSTKASPIPALEISEAEQKRLASGVEGRARQALQAGGEPLTFNEAEINSMLAQSADFRRFTNQIYMRPESNYVRAELSVPLDQFEQWRKFTDKMGDDLKGRYFNGSALLRPGVTNGTLIVTVGEVIVNGTALPESFVGRLKSQNLAGEANKSPELKEALSRVENIVVTNGQVLVEFKDAP